MSLRTSAAALVWQSVLSAMQSIARFFETESRFPRQCAHWLGKTCKNYSVFPTPESRTSMTSVPAALSLWKLPRISLTGWTMAKV